ncbi:MAG: OsmC family protein [Actinomycetota bacterium]|nr:OsmC family protein [Actinomycetota bacterium]
MAIERSSSARWEGDLKGGNGHFSLGSSGAISGSYTYASRFESGEGTNPEELIAGAHAACYAMAFSNMLAGEGHTPERMDVTATATLDMDAGKITKIHLVANGRVPGVDEATFEQLANKAKDGCPISATLAAVDEITLDATLQH